MTSTPRACAHRRAAGNSLLIGAVLCTLLASTAFAQVPAPVITVVELESPSLPTGQAPFTVHVHALESILAAGTPETAHYVWDFGDPESAYNEIIGWGGAHTYDTPGVYTLTLNITNEDYGAAEATMVVTVTADARTPVYVSNSGDDARNGATPGTAIATVSRLNELLTGHTAVYFERGGTYDFSTEQVYLRGLDGLHFGAYGTGAVPVLMGGDLVSEGAPGIFTLLDCPNAVVEDLMFTTPREPVPPDEVDLFKGIIAQGVNMYNLTIRRCVFDDVGFSVHFGREFMTEVWPRGLLLQECTADLPGRYLLYGDGDDITLMGNHTNGTYEGHSFRMYADRLWVYDNRLETDWIHLAAREQSGLPPGFALDLVTGQHAYVARNDFYNAIFVGYETQFGLSAFQHVVIEANTFQRCCYQYFPTIRLMPDADNINIRNNVFLGGQNAIRFEEAGAGVEGYSNRVRNVRVLNNTVLNDTDFYTFLELSGMPDTGAGYTIANNLHVQPLFIGGAYNGTYDPYIVTMNETPRDMVFSHNLYQTPLGGEPFRITGDYISLGTWSTYAFTTMEAHHDLHIDDFAIDYAPPGNSLANGHAVPVTGVLADFHGVLRPQELPWTTGAVELTGRNIPVVHTADVDGNGRLSLSELLRVVQLFNAGRYGCFAESEDGYLPGGMDETCPHHDADYADPIWRVSLGEILRIIQLYNWEDYSACSHAPESEDGFCRSELPSRY